MPTLDAGPGEARRKMDLRIAAQRALAGDASGGAAQALAGAVTGTGKKIPAGEQQAAGGGV